MREDDRSADGSLRAVLEAEASAGVTTALCLALLADLAWVAQQDPTGTMGVAKTLTTDLSETLRWGLVIGLGVRGLGGPVQGGLGRSCWRVPREAYGALAAGMIWLAGAALAYASHTPAAALRSALVLAMLALGTCGVSLPVVWWMAGHHREHVAERLATIRRAAAREQAHQRGGPASDDG